MRIKQVQSSGCGNGPRYRGEVGGKGRVWWGGGEEMGSRYGTRGGSPLKHYFKTPLTVTYCCNSIFGPGFGFLMFKHIDLLLLLYMRGGGSKSALEWITVNLSSVAGAKYILH